MGMRIIALAICLFFCPFLSEAQVEYSTYFGGSINYKGYQTGLGFRAQYGDHSTQFSFLRNNSVDRLFGQNHFAIGASYQYYLSMNEKLQFGPELDVEKMWLTKVDNRYSDARIVSIAYFLQWQITQHVYLTNSIGIGGYVERLYIVNEEEPEYFRGIGGLIKLQCGYRF